MFFRNLTFLRFPKTWGALVPTEPDIAAGMHEMLHEARLRPVGPLEMMTAGFVSPFGRDDDELTHTLGTATLITIGTEEKILPAAVVNDLLQRKLDEIEEREGRRPSARARKRLKDDLLHELLPRAFVKPGRTAAYFDFDNALIVVDTSSRRAAENVASEVRGVVGSFPALPLNAEVAPRSVLTGWLAGEPLPDGISLGEECEMRDPIDGGAVVRLQNAELRSEEVDQHLQAGLQCTRLALCLDDHLSFVLGEDLGVRKLRFLDGALDELSELDEESVRAELDARFALQVGELRRLWVILAESFKVSEVDPATEAPQVRQREPRTVEPSEDPRQQKLLGDTADPLASEALNFVRHSMKASISALQRHLKVGYNRAARLIEALEAAGVVSPPDPMTGGRTVLLEATAHA